MIRRIPRADAYVVLSRDGTWGYLVVVVLLVVIVVVIVVVIGNSHATRFLFLRLAESKSERAQTIAYV